MSNCPAEDETSKLHDRSAQRLLECATHVSDAKTPMDVLDRLHDITVDLNLSVLGALRFPESITAWDSLRLGENVFLHREVPEGWWTQWVNHVSQRIPLGVAHALLSIAPFTLTESLQVLQPIGVERWGVELASKYGIRDGYFCPVGGRWLVCFRSAKPIAKTLTQPLRIMIFTAATFGVLRIEQLISLGDKFQVPGLALTPRQLAVFRLLSVGMSLKEAAHNLGLSDETAKTHLKKALAKMGLRNCTQAVAEAIRQRLILILKQAMNKRQQAPLLRWLLNGLHDQLRTASHRTRWRGHSTTGKGGLHGEELGGSLRPYRMPCGTHLAPGLSKRCLVLRHS